MNQHASTVAKPCLELGMIHYKYACPSVRLRLAMPLVKWHT